MTADEIRHFILSKDKLILGNIELSPADGYESAFKFLGSVDHGGDQEVRLNIWFNPDARPPKLQIAYVVEGVGRIYGLCMNKRHAGMLIHKHNSKREDDKPYVPNDITAPADDPQAVWAQFCTESSLDHIGAFLVSGRGTWIPPLTEV